MAIKSLHFEDVDKPYPETNIANITFKIMRFLYPPYGKEPLIVTFDVISPEPNKMNIMLSIAVLLGFLLVFFVLKNIRKHRKALALKKKQLEEQEQKEVPIDHTGPEVNRNDWLSESSESDARYEAANIAAAIKQVKTNNFAYIEDTNNASHGLDVGGQNLMNVLKTIVIGKPPQNPHCGCN